MKGTRFEAISSIQQTVTRELKAIWEEAFSRAFDSLYDDAKVMRKRAGTIQSDGINKYFLYFFVWFYGLSSGT
jgi:transposase-like protein